MSRPRRGEAGHDQANAKWKATIEAKYGSVTEFMKNVGHKGGLAKTPTGGFGSNKIGPDGLTGRERAKIAGAKGGRISRRTKKTVEEAE